MPFYGKRKTSSYRKQLQKAAPATGFDLYPSDKMTSEQYNDAVSTAFKEPRKKPVQWEHLEQVEVIRWIRDKMATYPQLEMVYAVPNGGWRDQKTANHLKAEGCQSGVPDLVFPVARGGYFGAYFEMKTKADKTRGIKNGTVSESQEWWLHKLQEEGYLTQVCYGADEAITAFKNYLAMPRTKVV